MSTLLENPATLHFELGRENTLLTVLLLLVFWFVVYFEAFIPRGLVG